MALMQTGHEEKEGRTAAGAERAAGGRTLPMGEIVLTHAYFLSRTQNEKKLMKPYVPLGPLYVASALRQHGSRVRFYDTTFDRDLSGFGRLLDGRRPPLVGIYVLETTRAAAVEMIRMCAARRIPVMVGGPDPSLDPEFYILRGARYVATGEAEETAPELVAALRRGEDGRSVPGIYSDGGFSGERKTAAGAAPDTFPARDLLDFTPYFDAWRRCHGFTSMQISIARGSACRCTACAGPVPGARYRMRSPRHLAEEMLFVKMIYHPDRVWFCDGVVGHDREWICDLRDEVARKRAKMPFECGSRPDLVDAWVVKQLKESGCFRVWYDVASGSPRVLEKMKKGFTVDDIRRAAALTRAAGIEVGFTVTLGYPGESVADVEMTRDLVRGTRPDRCTVEVAYPQKGTEFYREVEADILPVRYSERREHDNILTYRAKYSQDFYDVARKLIQKESSLYVRPSAGLADWMGVHLFRLGYGLMKNGVQ